MDKYNSKNGCPKCGSKDIHDKYYGSFYQKYDEFIERRCRNCSYYWNELPLDMKLETKKGDKK